MPTKKTTENTEDLGLKETTDLNLSNENEKLKAEIELLKNKENVFNEKHDYWKVIFAAKDNPQASDQVHLGLNGEILVMCRNVEVIVPSTFLEVADHAVAKQYRQLPGEERRVVGEIKTYPYTKIAPSTKEEFLKMKREGVAANKKNNSKTV